MDLDMLLTFQSGQEALEAIKYDQQHMAGEEIRVSLRTPHWFHLVEDDLREEFPDPLPVADTNVSELLADDVNIPSMSFDIEGITSLALCNFLSLLLSKRIIKFITAPLNTITFNYYYYLYYCSF